LYNPKRDGIDHPGHSTGGGNRSHVERLDSGFKNAPKRQDKTNGETPMNISAAFPLFLKQYAERHGPGHQAQFRDAAEEIRFQTCKNRLLVVRIRNLYSKNGYKFEN
jgi:hypothetical protein